MRNKIKRPLNLSMMNIEKKIAKSLDLKEVVDKYAVNHNNRKIILVLIIFLNYIYFNINCMYIFIIHIHYI